MNKLILSSILFAAISFSQLIYANDSDYSFIHSPELSAQAPDALSFSILSDQQNTNEQIKNLQQQNQKLESRIATLGQQLNTISFNIAQLHQRLSRYDSHNYSLAVIHNLQDYWLGLVASLLLLSTLLYFYKKPRHRPVINPQVEPPLEEEYNFLEGAQSIPTKLDLIRAYIDMDDSEAATQLIKEVLFSGNEEQRVIAQELLQKLNS